ncbi:MAG TPA: SCO family protein [Stellaceae bacterium]|nr:SCO family protein [Stellaceae bacterium]
MLAAFMSLFAGHAWSQSMLTPADFSGLAVAQRLGDTLPLDVVLRDENGNALRLGDILRGKPLLLFLGYFHCPNLCGIERRSMVERLDSLDLAAGKDFDVAVVSVDPRETAADASEAKAADLALYTRHRAGAGWHYLSGDAASLARVAQAAGFPYRYDASIDQYAHPIGLILATPSGVLARYIQGVDYTARDLQLGLFEAARGTISAPAARLLLLCYHYDPAAGRYDLAVGDALRWLAAASVGGFALLLLLLARKRRGA